MIRRSLFPVAVGLSILLLALLFTKVLSDSTVKAIPHVTNIYFDGKEVTSKEQKGYYFNGTSYLPSTLEYEGTLYVPISLVGTTLNKPIRWNQPQQTVWLGTNPQPSKNQPPTQPTIASSSPIMSPAQPTQAAPTAKEIDETPSLFGLSLGDSLEKVIATVGQPTRKEPSALGYEWFIYNQNWNSYLQVGILNGKVVDLYSNAPKAAYAQVSIGTSYQSLTRKHNPKQLVTFSYQGAQIEISNQLKQRALVMVDETPVIYYLDQHNQHKVTAIRLLDRLPLIQGGFYETKWTYRGKAPQFNPPALSIKQQELVNIANERQILDITNVMRFRYKLPLLKWNETAAKVARSHSDDMENNQFFDHISATTGLNPFQRLQQAGVLYQLAGENIAAGYPDAIEAVENWMNSLGHRKNILEKGFTELGSGAVSNYYTQNFVTPKKQ